MKLYKGPGKTMSKQSFFIVSSKAYVFHMFINRQWVSVNINLIGLLWNSWFLILLLFSKLYFVNKNVNQAFTLVALGGRVCQVKFCPGCLLSTQQPWCCVPLTIVLLTQLIQDSYTTRKLQQVLKLAENLKKIRN